MRDFNNWEGNKYRIDNLYIGQTESFTINLTDKMQQMFREITGDTNPIHSDSDFACMQGFSDKIVYGMLTASFFSTLVGVYLPGKNCIFRSCNVEWPSPCYIGDSLNICGKIVDIHKESKVITIKALIKNQNNKKIARARLQVEVRDYGE